MFLIPLFFVAIVSILMFGYILANLIEITRAYYIVWKTTRWMPPLSPKYIAGVLYVIVFTITYSIVATLGLMSVIGV